MSAKIIIGGDLVPTANNYKLFANGNAEELIGTELKNLLDSADFTIFNLEVPLTDKESPIQKCGPCLIAPTGTIAGLKGINPDFFTLANNHILDQGEQGLFSTVETLEKAGIAYAGAGKDLQEASEEFVKEINGIKVGIYCCAEHEFSIATDKSAGANPFDPLESPDHICKLKAEVDYLIVLYHGGKEHYRYPSPYLRKVCRKCVDKGANLVVCQHSHCIGCEEKWNGGTIVYGQGNFLFDRSESEFWQTGLLIEVELEPDDVSASQKGTFHAEAVCRLRKAAVTYIPLTKTGNKIRKAEGKRSDEIMAELRRRTEAIKSKGFVEETYRKFAEEMRWNYLSGFAGKDTKNLAFRAMNKLSGYYFMKEFLGRKYGQSERLTLWNFCECEAHRELMLEGLKEVTAHE